MAFELQAAKTKQRIMEEQMQVKVVERSQEIAVAEQEMLRRTKELDATVRRPADAEKYRYIIIDFYYLRIEFNHFYTRSFQEHSLNCRVLIYLFSIKRLEKMAEANRLRQIMEAEAEAEAIRIRGDAEAFAIDAKGKAEAEQMAKKAAAMNEYKSAAMIDMMLDVLPKVSSIFSMITIF